MIISLRNLKMKQVQSKFFKVFEKANDFEHQNIDPLTHSLPPTHYTLNSSTSQLLQKIRDSISMVTSIGFSSDFFGLTRKMLLLDNSAQSQKGSRCHNHSFNELYLASKIEIVPARPAEWIYGELKLRKEDNDGSLSPIRITSKDLLDSKIGTSAIASILGSTVLVAEAVDNNLLSQIVKFIKEVHDKVRQLNGAFPRVYLVYNPKKQNQNDFNQQISLLRTRQISVELITAEEKEGWQEQYRLLSYGKSLISGLRPKIMHNVAVTAKLLHFLWSSLANSGDLLVPNSIWEEAQQSLMKEQEQHAFQQYASRIDDLVEGQQMLSESFFKQAQAKVRADVLKQAAERSGFLGQSMSIMRTERRLLQWKEDFQSKNSRAVLDWGRQFIREAWGSIEKKLCKEIKSVFALRQEIQIFFEFFKKKSEQFISSDLILGFIQFLLPKLFESVATITNAITAPMQQQQMKMQAQIMTLASESKQLRKRLGKEDNELSRRLQELKEKNLQLETNYGVSERCLEISKKQSFDLRENYEDKLTAMSEEHQKILRQKSKIIDELTEKCDKRGKKVQLLDSQLNKEKLLHEQTKRFYEESVEMLKLKQAQARTQLEEVSLSASRELNMVRAHSSRQADDYEENNAKLLQKLATQEQLLLQRDEALDKMKRQLATATQKLLERADFADKIAQLQLRNKILEDNQTQCQLLRARCRKLQQQQRRIQKEKEQHIFFCQQAQTKALLAQERFIRLSEQLDTQRSKQKSFLIQLQQIRLEKEQLEDRLTLFKEKEVVDACYQTQNNFKDALQLALEQINQLEALYQQAVMQKGGRRF